MFTNEDILHTQNNSKDWKERIFMSKRYLAIAASIVILITAGLFGYKFLIPQQNNNEATTEKTLNMLSDEATTVLTLDINPSIEIYLDANNNVIDVQALNDDAATLDLSQFIGMTAEDAVEGIVTLAKESGFINETDTTEDYVLLTVADINDDDIDDSLKLEERLRERIRTSEELQALNVALIKATLAEIKEAEGKGVPFGLYVINGMVESDGEYLTVKEFFASSENKDLFVGKGNLYEMSASNKAALAEKMLTQLENAGEDVTSLRAMLGDPNADVTQLLSQIRTTYENYGEITGNDNGNGNSDNNENNGNGNTSEIQNQSTSQSQTQNQTQNQTDDDDDADDDSDDYSPGQGPSPGGKR